MLNTRRTKVDHEVRLVTSNSVIIVPPIIAGYMSHSTIKAKLLVDYRSGENDGWRLFFNGLSLRVFGGSRRLAGSGEFHSSRRTSRSK